MDYIQEIKKVLSEWEASNVGYALLRNYEFLLEQFAEPGNDLDLVISRKDFVQARKILLWHGFVESPRQFSLSHKGIGKYFVQDKLKFGFDIQLGGVHWNDIPYLDAEEVLRHKLKVDNIHVLSDDDSFIMYVCHSLLGKRYFKEKYKKKLIELYIKGVDKDYIYEHLSKIFTKKIARKILEKVERRDFDYLEKRAYFFAGYYVLHRFRNTVVFTKLFFRWLIWLRIGKSYPMVSFIGPDGSGKTTAAEHICEILKKNKREASLIYMGRGKGNFLPIKNLAARYKKYEEKQETYADLKKSSFGQKLIYSAAAPVYTLDLLVRYFSIILPLRKCKKIVVTDRYCSDILLMPHVPFVLKRMLLSLFPKPSLTFYLRNDADILYNRRKQQSLAELERQMRLFGYLSRKFKAIEIKTTSFEKDSLAIEEAVFTYLMKNRY